MSSEDDRQVILLPPMSVVSINLIVKPEYFQTRSRAEGGKERKHLPSPVPTIQFFDPVGQFPQFCPMIGAWIWMVDVNLQQPRANVGEDHVEKRRSDVAEINCSPQGRIAEGAAPPLITNVEEGKQASDA